MMNRGRRAVWQRDGILLGPDLITKHWTGIKYNGIPNMGLSCDKVRETIHRLAAGNNNTLTVATHQETILS